MSNCYTNKYNPMGNFLPFDDRTRLEACPTYTTHNIHSYTKYTKHIRTYTNNIQTYTDVKILYGCVRIVRIAYVCCLYMRSYIVRIMLVYVCMVCIRTYCLIQNP
jgi:hypothetical protein